MLFNSFAYLLLFLPCVVLLTMTARRLAGHRAAQGVVLAASLFFYAWWKPAHLGYLLASIAVNWLLARRISAAAQPARKRWVQFAIAANIAYLCSFKYVAFFFISIPMLAQARLHLPDLAFPLGISFFTLMQVMYQVDVYEDALQPLSLFDHSTFVAFFPYVISGPIARAKRTVKQFANFGGELNGKSATAGEGLARGLYLFSVGLLKKVVFAFPFSLMADFGFAPSRHLSALEAWAFSIAFTLQIYFDFSGYTDMALGSAMMLGVEIPRNFDAPLRSTSIIEFWQRWHISLSSFITGYLYTPIFKALPRRALLTPALATMCAMLIAGLWHGPKWTFVLFGGLHGIGLVANLVWRRKQMPELPAWLCWVLTFTFVNVAFIFFRSASVTAGGAMVARLFSVHQPFSTRTLREFHDGFTLTIFGIPMLIGAIVAFAGKASDQYARDFAPGLRSAMAVAGMLAVAMLFLNSNISQQFVYFKF